MYLILASQSPRRQELLRLFGVPFVVRVSDIDETMDETKPAFQEVARVSRCKALAVPREPGDVVIAADTIVVCQGKVLGKPKNEQQAEEMLSLLSGRDHQVMTGVTVLRGETERVFTEVTDLHFRTLSRREILGYIATKEPMDKAGAYGIQGIGSLLVQGIEGDYQNVVGLPASPLMRCLAENFGFDYYKNRK